jgi:hypothetical protein
MDLLDRLHQRFAAAASLSPDGSGGTPVTIADLYQRIIPYRLVRGEGGVMELAEYEHALLRLLAGERRLVELGQDAVTMEFRRELASPNPILGIYRDYANVEVRLIDSGRAAGGPGVGASKPASPVASQTVGLGRDRLAEGVRLAEAGSPGRVVPEGAPAKSGSDTDSVRVTPAPPPSGASHPAAPDVRQTSAMPASHPGAPKRVVAPSRLVPSNRCRSCQRALPDHPELRFCPFCGTSTVVPTCGNCGVDLDDAWTFCVRCGTPRAAPPSKP